MKSTVQSLAPIPSSPAAEVDTAQRFSLDGDFLTRTVIRRDGSRVLSHMGPSVGMDTADLEAAADLAFLKGRRRPSYDAEPPSVRFADLFAGCGALSLGVLEAARAAGRSASCVLAVDVDPHAISVYGRSLPAQQLQTADLTELIDGKLGGRRTRQENNLLRSIEGLDLLVAGPPCQGHSALNNHSRHDDERNDLYLRVARFAELGTPTFIMVENVASVTRDRRRSAARAREHLESLGYATDEGLADLNRLGVPQLRRRHVLVASAPGAIALEVVDVLERYAVSNPAGRTVGWAIGDLERRNGGPFHQASIPSQANRARIDWLHQQDEHNLPNSRRPPCHRDDHTYKSMYGRLWWDRPAQTITSGFGSAGQGRYVHPTQRRTITPHEAARLQLIPDFFDFSSVRHRGRWAQMIGNAAPFKLSYAFALEALR